ncbi:MAG: hypothetical protein QM728_13075 [Gordonia sp. (in: high G+C Gram-positive bacteria)]|uniref:hypothetical protein n=1 Tax=Gordonia sp. (in: high G+C Gram-positive bacteria) TaxID=84139 RepID=UPI0039E26F4C
MAARRDLLAAMPRVLDPEGKSYFLVPRDMGGPDLRRAVLDTYVANAGGGYPGGDFPVTPFSPDEIARVEARQTANRWTYNRVAGWAMAHGAALATTPNGMLMGMGGNPLARAWSQQGGTTWGDLFLINVGRGVDPTDALTATIVGGAPVYRRKATLYRGDLPLDLLLHHEEIHARQWARYGRARFAAAYLREQARAARTGTANRYEVEAGLADGGY